MTKLDIGVLRQRQNMSLDEKVNHTGKIIIDWYNYWKGNVYVSFSGGKDSTVLLHLVRELYPHVPAVFADTGLEYPEIREFVKTVENAIWVRPKMTFKDVVEKYGYPVISKEQALYIRQCQNPSDRNFITRRRRLEGIDQNGQQRNTGMISQKWRKLIDAPFKVSEWCCYVLKKSPMGIYERKNGLKRFVGNMASDSNMRQRAYLRYGCNAFDQRMSQPLAFWLESDVWGYIKGNAIPYSTIYDKGCDRTGCMFCMFGVHMEKHPNRFERMRVTHPKQYNYCVNMLGCGKVLDFIGVRY